MASASSAKAAAEAAEHLQKICTWLTNAGYFRARLSGLSAFDKLTGGLAWCIAASSGDADIDLLYDDDATLGEKIKVGEAIEAALRRLACPYGLQAHQIQGLDYPALLPVLTWLLRRVAASRKERAAQLRSYALYEFKERFGRLAANQDEPQKETPSPKTFPRRKFRLKRGSRQPSDAIQRLQLILLEYGELPSGLLVSELEDLPDSVRNFLEAAPQPAAASETQKRKTTNRSTEGVDGGESERAQQEFDEVAELQRQVAAQEARSAELAARRERRSSREELLRQDEERRRLEALQECIWESAEKAELKEELHAAVALMKNLQNLKEQQTELRANCRMERAKLQAELGQLSAATSAAETARRADVEAAYQEALLRWQTQRAEAAQKSRLVAALRRRAEERPNRAERSQYERRFMELYEQVQKKHLETRKYYATHNALADAHKLALKELSLLDSIVKQFGPAMASSGGRAAFLESMQNIAAGAQQMLTKAEAKIKSERDTCEQVRTKHADAVAEQRGYFAALKEFQEECAHGERLRALLQNGL